MANAGKYFIVYSVVCATVFMLINKKIQDNSESIFSVQLILEKTDELVVYYAQKQNPLSEINTIRKKVQGQNKLQTIDFTIPASTNKLRFDLGRNKNQEVIKIANIELKGNDKQKTLAPDHIIKYFKPNHHIQKIEVVDNLLEIKTQTVKDIYDPHFKELNIHNLYR